MEKATLRVEGMKCEHCVKAVTKAVSALPGISGVSVSLAGKTVELDYDPAAASLETVKAAIEDQGFDVGE